MNRAIGGIVTLVLVLGAGASPPAPAQAPTKEADAPFRLQCASASAKFLPKGNAAVGDVKFVLEVDPAAKRVSMDGDKRKATIDKYEISFRSADGPIVSISRSRKTFRVVVPIKDAGEDSRQYVMYEGSCKTV
jgi:hypothetical protein